MSILSKYSSLFKGDGHYTLSSFASDDLISMECFASNHPLRIIQDTMLFLERKLTARGGEQATILGRFKPVRDASEFPLPIFWDPQSGELMMFAFHGTKDQSKIAGIAKQGFLIKFSGTSSGSLYGDGIYFADRACKSVQYAGEEQNLFFCALFLGRRRNVYFTNVPASHSDFKMPVDARTVIAVPHPPRGVVSSQYHLEVVIKEESSVVPLLCSRNSFFSQARDSVLSPVGEIELASVQCPVM